MKKYILNLAVCLILFLLLIPGVSASENLPMIIDSADVLDSIEEQRLEEKAQALRSEYLMDVVILTINSLDGVNAQDYADDYFDQNGYGYADTENGILFLLAMTEREWYISTCGDAIYAVTDYGVQQLGETAVYYLSDGYYYDAFDVYLEELPYYLDAYSTGAPVDGYADYSGDYYHGEQEEIVYYEQDRYPNFLLSLVIGIASAAVVILIMKGSMNTKRQQHGAAGYMKAGSFHLRTRQDLFLYSNVSKVRRQQNNTSRSGGGSSVHRSSGGRHHGGGGGRF